MELQNPGNRTVTKFNVRLREASIPDRALTVRNRGGVAMETWATMLIISNPNTSGAQVCREAPVWGPQGRRSQARRRRK